MDEERSLTEVIQLCPSSPEALGSNGAGRASIFREIPSSESFFFDSLCTILIDI